MIINNGLLKIGETTIDLRGIPTSCTVSVWLNNIYKQYCIEIDYKGNTCKENHDYLGSIEYVFDYSTHITLEKEIKHLEVINKSSAAQDKLIERYSRLEILSWDVQEKEANALCIDIAADAPLLSRLATERGIPLSDMRDKVIKNVSAFRSATAHILSQQQKKEDEIKRSQSEQELSMIDITFS